MKIVLLPAERSIGSSKTSHSSPNLPGRISQRYF